PEAVPIARDDREAGDAVVADEVVDFAALGISDAEVRAARGGVRRAGPGMRGHARGQVLRVDALVGHTDRIAPGLPRRPRSLQALLEPSFLLRPENGERRSVLAWIGDANLAKRDFRRRSVTVEGAAGIQDLDRVLRGEAGEIGAAEFVRVGVVGRIRG